MFKKVRFFLIVACHDIFSFFLASFCIIGSLLQPFSAETLEDTINIMASLGALFFGLWAFCHVINSYITTPKYDKKYKQILINNAQLVGLAHPLFSGPTLIKLPAVRGQFYAAQLAFPWLTMKALVYRKWFEGEDLRKEANLLNYLLAYILCMSAFLCVLFFLSGAILTLVSFVAS